MTDKQKDAKTEAQGVGTPEWLADVKRCLEDVSTQFRATGQNDSRFVQLLARISATKFTLSTPASHDAQKPAREEMSPDFTDSARAAIAWVLYHHQGGSSPVGQPLRFALGMGAHEPLPDWRIAEAKAWAEWASATTADFHAQQPAVVGDGVPLRVFSAGGWTYDGTGQTFSHEDMDAAAFVAYRDNTALTPAATQAPRFTPSDADRHRCLNCGLHVADHVPDEEGARCKRNAVETLHSYTRPPAQKEGNGNG